VTGLCLSRRAFLAGSCSAVALAPVAQAARLGSAYDDTVWDGLVSAIAGPVKSPQILRDALKRDFTKTFGVPALQDLVAHFGRAGIATVLDVQDGEREEQVRWIAAYLFTGSADPADKNAPMINYPYALGWKSLSFAKAPGLCSGPEFGYWLNPWEAA